MSDKGAAILAMLKQHGGLLSPRALASALGFKSLPALAYHTKPMAKAKQVIVTGATTNRRVSLPGAAKEVPYVTAVKTECDEEFETVWNGGPLTGPAPGLGSTLSGGECRVSIR